MKRTSREGALLLLLGLALPAAVPAQSTAVRRPSAVSTLSPNARVDSAAIRRLRDAAAGVGLPAASTVATQPPPQATQPKTISRERLEAVLGGSRASIRVVRVAGVADLPRASDSVRLAPGEFVFRKMADTATRITGGGVTPSELPGAASATTYAMPYRWLTLDSAGVERLLVPFFVLAGGGLTYDVASRTYRGVALVGVEDTLNPSAGSVTLVRPLRLQLMTTSGGTVSPTQLAIAHTSLDYDSVRIESADATHVRIRTGADPAGIVVPIPVRAMSLALVPQQRTLPGFGLATTDIALTLPRGMSRGDTAVVTFSSTSAPVRPGTVRVTGAEASTVRLRSGLPGVDSIHAFIDGVQVGEAIVTFVAPWSFLGATLAGILLGGFARFAGAKRRKKARALYWDMVKGAPFGILAAAAGAIGLDWLQLKIDDPGTWIAIMLTAAVGARVGSRLLERVAPLSAPAPAGK